jgi:hypothetical protein
MQELFKFRNKELLRNSSLRSMQDKKEITMESILSSFALTYEQANILFSIRYHLLIADVKQMKTETLIAKKNKWINDWLASTNEFLKAEAESKDVNSLMIETEKDILNSLITNSVKESLIKTPYYLILLEATLQDAYYSLDGISIKVDKSLAYFIDFELLKEFAILMGIDPNIAYSYINTYRKSIRSLTGYWKKIFIGASIGAVLMAITAGTAAPAIAALLAPIGLSGGAATMAGLALLGGGALAAGGLGVAGGFTVVIAGGAILGCVLGTAGGRLLVANPTLVLTESAKLEVIMKEVILTEQKDTRFAQELIKEQRKAIHELEIEVISLKEDTEKNKEKIKNIEKSIKYMRKAADSNEKLL